MKCFECDSTDNLQNHHVVPRSLGGKKTVKLCGICHGIIHGLDFTDHGLLVRNGLQRARENNIQLGRRQGKVAPKNIMANHKDIIENLSNGMSIRKTAEKVGKGMSTVQRVKKLMEDNKETI